MGRTTVTWLTRIIRWLLSVVLLVVVWRHAHWSVAAELTGLSIANELHSFVALKNRGPRR